jgi:catechol 2,3-dioxygenase-like lactoylglutathione lyase family enzyme
VTVTHVAIVVADQQRARAFYERYFGFDAGPATMYPDGVLIVRDAAGFSLALGPGGGGDVPAAFDHFGFDLDSPDEVRALRARLVADGVPIVEDTEEPAMVGFKCLDPDGHRVEVAWEVVG